MTLRGKSAFKNLNDLILDFSDLKFEATVLALCNLSLTTLFLYQNEIFQDQWTRYIDILAKNLCSNIIFSTYLGM